MDTSTTNVSAAPLKMPSLMRMAVNLAGSMADATKYAVQHGGHIISDQPEAMRRLAICQACEFLDKSNHRCAKCGCFMLIKVKAITAKCPITKW